MMRARGPRPVWREPMLWLVTGLPLLVLVAAAVTLALALRAPVDASATQVRRIAQVQLQDLAPDREAARRGLRARLEVDPARGLIEVRLATGSDATGVDEHLVLQLLHPVSARHDRLVPLQRAGYHWRAQIEPWSPQAWEVRLAPPRGEWRVGGRLPRGQRDAVLAPAVAR
jgi:uncharacterized protein